MSSHSLVTHDTFPDMIELKGRKGNSVNQILSR